MLIILNLSVGYSGNGSYWCSIPSKSDIMSTVIRLQKYEFGALEVTVKEEENKIPAPDAFSE